MTVVVRSVDAGGVAVQALSRAAARSARDAGGTPDGPAPRPDAKVAEAIRAARVAALRSWKRTIVAAAPDGDGAQMR